MKDRTHSCCFFGQRKLPKDKLEAIIKRLNREIDQLISQGVTDFISAGALGFDQVAASLIIAKKEMGQHIRLIFVLPCKDQNEHWHEKKKKLYHNLLAEADEVILISEEFENGCIKERNRFMINHSSVCLCALFHSIGSTNQSIKYARQRGLKLINVGNLT